MRLDYTTTWLLDRLHVTTSNVKAIKFIYKKLNKKKYWETSKEKRKAYLKAIIEHRENNLQVYIKVSNGCMF